MKLKVNYYQMRMRCANKLIPHSVIARLCFFFTAFSLMLSPVLSTTCGDGHFESPPEACDDANVANGDGCSSTCLIEASYRCVNSASSPSDCRIDTVVSLSLLGAERVSTGNQVHLYFHMQPVLAVYRQISNEGLMVSSLAGVKQLGYMESESYLRVKYQYGVDIEGTTQSFTLLLNNTKRFWHPTNTLSAQLAGANCELTYDNSLAVVNALRYVGWVLVAVSSIVFFVSMGVERWVGLQLMQTYQAVFLLSAMLKKYPFQLSVLYQTLGYCCGFTDLLSFDFNRIYTLSTFMNSMRIEKQFLVNFNVVYILIGVVIAVLLCLVMLRRTYRRILSDEESQDIRVKLQAVNRNISSIFGNVFLPLVLFSMYAAVFCFGVQVGNEYSKQQIFAEQLNIALGIFLLVAVFGSIALVVVRFMVISSTDSGQEPFMLISFQHMSRIYPIVYLAYQSLFVIVLSVYYGDGFAAFFLLVVESFYLILLFVLQPYSSERRCSKFLNNSGIILNHASVIAMTAIAIRWNDTTGTAYQTSSHHELLAYTFLMIILLTSCTVVSIIRLAAYHREVTCCTSPPAELEELNYETMKRLTESKQLADYTTNTINIELKVEQERPNQAKERRNSVITDGQFEYFDEKIFEELDDDDPVGRYLGDRYADWTNLKKEKPEQSDQSRVLRRSKNRKASMSKYLLQECVQRAESIKRT